jgi:hypothetical protein
LLVISSYGQTIINAMVADSAALRPLAFVNIQVLNKSRGVTSNEGGYFIIAASEDDTLQFSMVGYYSKKYPVNEIKERFIIYLTEEVRTLEPVVIDGNVLIPGLKKIAAQSPYRNLTQDPRVFNTPGFQGIQTFGPGLVMGGPISRLSKYYKEQKKLARIKAENESAKGYAEMVNDENVKGEIMRVYAITEEEYFSGLALFNEKNKDIIYKLQPDEVTSLLLVFFGELKNKK